MGLPQSHNFTIKFSYSWSSNAIFSARRLSIVGKFHFLQIVRIFLNCPVMLIQHSPYKCQIIKFQLFDSTLKDGPNLKHGPRETSFGKMSLTGFFCRRRLRFGGYLHLLDFIIFLQPIVRYWNIIKVGTLQKFAYCLLQMFI